MTQEDREILIKHLMNLMYKLRDLPPRLLAERIVLDILEKSLNAQRDVFERLLFADPNSKH
jgi:hypothetical protein